MPHQLVYHMTLRSVNYSNYSVISTPQCHKTQHIFTVQFVTWAVTKCQLCPGEEGRRYMESQGQTSNLAPATISLNVKKQKQWTNEVMQAAVDAVREDHMPVLCASQLYKIPKTTLHDRISGKVLHGSKPGPKPYFSPMW